MVTALSLFGGAVVGADRGSAQYAPPRPNFVMIMTDDQSMETFNRRVMPRTFQALGGNSGTKFRNAYAVPPLCCPSRAGIQTGQYPHNHGVVANNYNLLRDNDNILSSLARQRRVPDRVHRQVHEQLHLALRRPPATTTGTRSPASPATTTTRSLPQRGAAATPDEPPRLLDDDDHTHGHQLHRSRGRNGSALLHLGLLLRPHNRRTKSASFCNGRCSDSAV